MLTDAARARRCHARRGFSVLELAVSLTVFAVIAGVTTFAIARTQLTLATTRLDRALKAELAALVEATSTSPYDLIAEGTFARPQACDADPASSCVSVLGREFTVTWTRTVASDLGDGSASNPASVTLTASATLPDGSVKSSARTAVSPNSGLDSTTGLVRVRVSGAAYGGPVFLLRPPAGVETEEQVVASGRVVSGTAVMRADAASCPASSPCRLALTADGSTRSGDITQDAASVLGAGSSVVLTAQAVAETGLVLRDVPIVNVGLLAASPDGQRGYPGTAGSACLWLSFPDDGSTRSVASCNDPDPGTVTFTTYQPDPTRPQIEVAIPQGVDLQVSTDSPAGTCPDLGAAGQVGWTGGGWTPAAVCTSWTWGPASHVLAGRDPGASPGPIASTPLRAGEGVSEYQVLWTGGPAIPAAGYAGQGTWRYPRTIPGCAATASCTPITTAPEDVGCPGEHCNSSGSHAPELADPLSSGVWATQAVYVTPSTTTRFDITAVDADPADTITVTATTVPAGLSTVTYPFGAPVYTPVTAAQVLAAGVASGTTVELGYTAGAAAITGTPVVLTLTDSGGATREVTVLLWNSATRWTAGPAKVTVRQGQASTLSLTALTQSGDPSTSTAGVSATPPAGLTVSGWSATGAGTITATVAAGSIAAGTYPVPVTVSAGQTATAYVTVLPSPGTVTVTAASSPLAQGDSGTVDVQVLDLAGDPLEGADTVITVTTGGDTALGVYSSPRACRTGPAGTCSTGLTVEAAAAPGVYQVGAQSGSVTAASVDVSVTTALTRLASAGATVAQSGAGTATVTAYDGRGTVVAGVTIVPSGMPTGMAVTFAAPTNPAGQSTATITVTGSVTAGTYPVTLTAGALTSSMRVVVTQTVASGTAPTTALAQGGVTTVTVTALDGAGDPVPGARMSITQDGQVRAGGSATTDSSGEASVSVSASTTAATGAHALPINAVVNGVPVQVGTVNVSVQPGVASATVTGTLVRGSGGDTLVVALRTADGDPVTGRLVTVTPTGSGITPASTSATTSGTGLASVTLVAAGTATPGVRLLNVIVDGRSIPAAVVVS